MSDSTLKLAATCLLAVCTLAGCAHRNPGVAEPRCRAAGATAQLGQKINDKLEADARAGSGAIRSRLVRYPATYEGEAVDPLRLNIEVDANGIVQRLRCG